MMRKTTRIALTGALAAALLLPAATARAEEITSDNWTEKVGFKPEANPPGFKKGKKIKSSNVGEVKALLPPSMVKLINEYGLKMKLNEYQPIHPSEGYIEATNKYLGQTKIIKTGKDFRKRGLKGYTAGLPFPSPKTGLEVAWNLHYSYQGDDGDIYYTVYWVSANSGIEHTEDWRWAYIIRTINRTDLDPKPAIKEFVDKRLQYTSITYALAPYDKKGFGAVFSRSVDPLDQQGHIYVPAMRRVLRNTFGTRGDAWNATDLLYEDVRGYMGYPEWMNWKIIGKKTILMPFHCGAVPGKKNHKKVYDLDKKPYWNPKIKYEPRPTYIVEATPRFPDYPYSKMHIYIDAETYLIGYKEAFDKKGDLWKFLMVGYSESPDMDELPPVFGAHLVIDFQAQHATVFGLNKVIMNSDLDTKMFSLSALRKRGR